MFARQRENLNYAKEICANPSLEKTPIIQAHGGKNHNEGVSHANFVSNVTSPQEQYQINSANPSPASYIEHESGTNYDDIQNTKRGGNINLDTRLDLTKIRTTHEKIRLLETIENEVPTTKSELTEKARQFVNQVMIPVLHCYRNHFNSDIDAFVVRWGKCVPHSQFSKNCSIKSPCSLISIV